MGFRHQRCTPGCAYLQPQSTAYHRRPAVARHSARTRLAALRHYPALLTPLLIQSFQLADDLAEALEARGFGRAGRTFWRDYRLRRRDWMVLATASAVCVGLVVFRWL